MNRILHTSLVGMALAGGLVTGVAAQMLAGSEWVPVEMTSAPFTPVADTFVRFEQDGVVSGHGGCNTFHGRFVTNGDALLMGPAAMTRMACPEDISRQEFAFAEALQAARLFVRDGADLTLSNAEGTVLMRLRQRNAD